eukprot:m.239278 g.239278  ORF g.239278 m.239278 type:complete len:698 (+) comp26576_c0_seq1:126-2219(+)
MADTANTSKLRIRVRANIEGADPVMLALPVHKLRVDALPKILARKCSFGTKQSVVVLMKNQALIDANPDFPLANTLRMPVSADALSKAVLLQQQQQANDIDVEPLDLYLLQNTSNNGSDKVATDNDNDEDPKSSGTSKAKPQKLRSAATEEKKNRKVREATCLQEGDRVTLVSVASKRALRVVLGDRASKEYLLDGRGTLAPIEEDSSFSSSSCTSSSSSSSSSSCTTSTTDDDDLFNAPPEILASQFEVGRKRGGWTFRSMFAPASFLKINREGQLVVEEGEDFFAVFKCYEHLSPTKPFTDGSQPEGPVISLRSKFHEAAGRNLHIGVLHHGACKFPTKTGMGVHGRFILSKLNDTINKSKEDNENTNNDVIEQEDARVKPMKLLPAGECVGVDEDEVDQELGEQDRHRRRGCHDHHHDRRGFHGRHLLRRFKRIALKQAGARKSCDLVELMAALPLVAAHRRERRHHHGRHHGRHGHHGRHHHHHHGCHPRGGYFHDDDDTAEASCQQEKSHHERRAHFHGRHGGGYRSRHGHGRFGRRSDCPKKFESDTTDDEEVPPVLSAGERIRLVSVAAENKALKANEDGTLTTTDVEDGTVFEVMSRRGCTLFRVVAEGKQGRQFLRITPDKQADANGRGGRFTFFKVIDHDNNIISLQSNFHEAPTHIGVLPDGTLKPPSSTGTGTHGQFRFVEVGEK